MIEVKEIFSKEMKGTIIIEEERERKRVKTIMDQSCRDRGEGGEGGEGMQKKRPGEISLNKMFNPKL